MRVTKADRERFVQLLAEHGLNRGGVYRAVGLFLEERGWKDNREVRVKLLSRMRSCNPNYAQCLDEWRAYYESERDRLRNDTAERHLTRALARDRHLESVFRTLMEQIEKARGKDKVDAVKALGELIKTELEVEKHERGRIEPDRGTYSYDRAGVTRSDAGGVGQVESAGAGGLVRELIRSLDMADGDTEESV